MTNSFSQNSGRSQWHPSSSSYSPGRSTRHRLPSLYHHLLTRGADISEAQHYEFICKLILKRKSMTDFLGETSDLITDVLTLLSPNEFDSIKHIFPNSILDFNPGFKPDRIPFTRKSELTGNKSTKFIDCLTSIESQNIFN